MGAAPVALMIDDPGARDLDDAIAVTALPEGGWRAVVDVAAVAAAVAPGSAPYQVARQRVMSVYRPAKVFPMLGGRVERAATLSADADREALAVSMLFGPDGQRLGAARLDRRVLAAGSCVRLPYGDVPAAADDPGHRWHEAVRATYELASVLRARRAAAGALAFYDLSRGYASTEDGTITTIPVNQRTIGYVMVSELMIAASAAVADWCVDHDVPIVFRNHRTSLLTVDGADLATDIAASLHDAELFEQLRQRVNRSFGKAVYDTVPRGHHGLRVPAYAHVTSPLRRFPDLVSQQMVWAHLAGERTPYTREQLVSIAEYVNGWVAKQQARRDKFFDEQKRKDALRSIAERDYAALDAGQWKQMFDVMTQRDPVEGIEAELLRRLDAQILLPHDVARMAAAGSSWTSVRQHVFPAVRKRHPEFGPSAVSGRAQILGQDPTAAAVETLTDPDPQAGPRFAARVVLDGHSGGWQVASTKKAAATQAMWDLLDVLCGHREPADEPFSWPAPPEQPAPTPPEVAGAGTEVPTVAEVDASGMPDAVARYLAGLNREQRDRAVGNPVSWLTNTAVQLGVGELKTDYQTVGPGHALIFVATVTVAGLRHAATAASKSQARVTAAGELLAAMLQAVPLRQTSAAGGGSKSAVAEVVSVDELPDAARQYVKALTDVQRDKAVKNPGAWVTNFAAAFGLGAPAYGYVSSGPSHGQMFMCTVSVAGLRATGHGSTKSQARTTAMDGLLTTLLADPAEAGSR